MSGGSSYGVRLTDGVVMRCFCEKVLVPGCDLFKVKRWI
jgi:hypothetical protein